MLETFFYLLLITTIAILVFAIRTSSSPFLFLTAVLMLVLGVTLLTEGIEREVNYRFTEVSSNITDANRMTKTFTAAPANAVWVLGNTLFYGSLIVAILAFWNYMLKSGARKKLERMI